MILMLVMLLILVVRNEATSAGEMWQSTLLKVQYVRPPCSCWLVVVLVFVGW